MKALWIRVEAHKIDSVVIAKIAEQVGAKAAHVLGHYVALGGAIAEHTDDGHIADIPAATLEKWAGWDGKKGDFARAVREHLQDSQGKYDEWDETMGQLVERRAKDRKRKRDKQERSQIPLGLQGNSEELPRKGRGDSAATGRDVTEREITTRQPAKNRAGRADGARVETPIEQDVTDSPFQAVMRAIREFLYVPDSLPPDGWDEARDGSIVKALYGHSTYVEILAAVEGLALVRDFPGKYADPVDWLRPGEKVTMRALYDTKSGVLSLFTIATNAYWKHANLSTGARV